MSPSTSLENTLRANPKFLTWTSDTGVVAGLSAVPIRVKVKTPSREVIV